jgi:hypothetical protein
VNGKRSPRTYVCVHPIIRVWESACRKSDQTSLPSCQPQASAPGPPPTKWREANVGDECGCDDESMGSAHAPSEPRVPSGLATKSDARGTSP